MRASVVNGAANRGNLGIEPEEDLEHARKVVDSRLVRARWMDKVSATANSPLATTRGPRAIGQVSWASSGRSAS